MKIEFNKGKIEEEVRKQQADFVQKNNIVIPEKVEKPTPEIQTVPQPKPVKPEVNIELNEDEDDEDFFDDFFDN